MGPKFERRSVTDEKKEHAQNGQIGRIPDGSFHIVRRVEDLVARLVAATVEVTSMNVARAWHTVAVKLAARSTPSAGWMVMDRIWTRSKFTTRRLTASRRWLACRKPPAGTRPLPWAARYL